MKKNIILLITIFMCTGLFGCAKVADEEAIKLELEANTSWGVLEESDTITEIEIISRETDKKLKRDELWCLVTIDGGDVMYKKEVEMVYGLYDEGWKADRVNVNYPETWIISPLKGVSGDAIKETIYGKSISVEGEDWIIQESNVEKLSVLSQETNLDERTDIITLDLCVDDRVEKIAGQLKITYNFDEQWEMSEITGEDSFVVSMKPEEELKVSDDEFIKRLLKQEYLHEGSGLSFSVKNDEISDFEIISCEITNKGAQQLFICKNKVSKPHISMEIESQFMYMHDGADWTSQLVQTNVQVIEIHDMEGTWEGEYDNFPNEGIAKMEIISVEGEEITAIYHYIPVGRYVDDPGSYNVSGKIDLDTLQMVLLAGEWVDEPSFSHRSDKIDVTAVLQIDDSIITGEAHKWKRFAVKKSE